MTRHISFFATLGQGGAERQIVETAKLLQNNGHRVSLYIYDHRKSFYRVENELEVIDIRLNLKGFPESIIRVASVFHLARLIARDKPDFVITYITLMNVTLGLVGLLNAFNRKTHFIGSERNSTLRYTKSTLWRLICRTFYHGLDMMTANNSQAISQLDSLIHYPKDLTFYLPNLLDTETFSPDPVDMQVNEKADHADFVILVPARITAQKNQCSLIELAKQLQNATRKITFNLAGTAEGPYFDELKKRVSDEGLSGSFVFSGQISNMVDAYRRSDLVYLPSKFEGLSNSMLEAMSCAALVAGSPIQTFTDLIRDGENGFIMNPDDSEATAQSILQILAMPRVTIQKMRLAARDTVIPFGSENYYNQFMRILNVVEN